MPSALVLRLVVGLALAAALLLPWGGAHARAELRLPQGAIAVNDLPPEAQETLRLIDRGGPFPYRRDGVEFANRERLLPVRWHGYYREYTVATPGSRDRGARRIITGRGGERYYTADHYRSFRRILP